MKKYIFVPLGREVSIGDMLVEKRKIFITNENLPELIKKGLIHEIDVPEITIQSAVKHLADRIGWKVNNLEKYFDNLYKIHPVAVFSVILKEVAIMLDDKYPDHINKCKEVWVIGTANGEIVNLTETPKIKNFRNFAAFRSFEDALEAKKIMATALRDLYGEQKD